LLACVLIRNTVASLLVENPETFFFKNERALNLFDAKKSVHLFWDVSLVLVL